jgi:hypothetical protein
LGRRHSTGKPRPQIIHILPDFFDILRVNMAYRSKYRRENSRFAKKSRTNFIISIILVAFLLYATIQWVLPSLIGGLGLVTGIFKHSEKNPSISENPTLAPPVLNIPFEATNNSQIDIKGYGTPNSKVTIYLDDQKKGTVDVSSDGSFELKSIELVLGINNIYAKSIDDKNQESLPSKTLRITYDNEKPNLEVSEPEDGKSVQGDRKQNISGKTEPQAQVFINDSKIIINSDGNFSTTYQLSDGENVFTIKAVDPASNSTEVIRKVNFQP